MNKMEQQKPELVCPAGDWRSLITAVDSGADSVYFGIKDINMRARAGNFDILELKKIMDYLHQRGKKGYLALNVIVLNHQLEKITSILTAAKEAAVDAVILWDMAVLAAAKQMGLPIHLSTQASVSNAQALQFYAGLGVRRAVLARECTLEDIKNVIDALGHPDPPCQVEAFIHGAMCVSISGRCFLSSYTFGRSANRGDCRQPCRREFEIVDTKGESRYTIGKDYLLSPKDLCTIDFIDRMIEAGIHAFKIEGRMRSVEYVKIVVSAYRRAIDAYFDGELTDSLKKELKEKLGHVYNRQFSPGFYFGQPEQWTTKDYQKSHEKIFLGEVVKYYKKIGVAEILIRNEKLTAGDRILVIGKHTPASFADVTELQQFHKSVNQVERGEAVGVKLPFRVRKNDQVFLWRKTAAMEFE